jgi:hypothetical protein
VSDPRNIEANTFDTCLGLLNPSSKLSPNRDAISIKSYTLVQQLSHYSMAFSFPLNRLAHLLTRVRMRVVETQDFKEATIAWASAVRSHDSIKCSISASVTGETYSDHHSRADRNRCKQLHVLRSGRYSSTETAKVLRTRAGSNHQLRLDNL